MSSEVAVSVNNISKTYYLYDNPLKRLFKRTEATGFQALRDVSMTVRRGSTVGIIGRNGSGKSTLLQIVAGILRPTGGSVEVHGKVAALLELGAGFNMDFTGRENVYLNAAVMGISRKKIEERYDDIVRFADIGEFINYPVKTYSSGMFVRLAFSVAINMDPEVLIIDEALSVGDAAFQHKCFAKFKQLQKQGTSILFVSHNVDAVKSFCNEAVLLDRGRAVFSGDPEAAVNRYYEMIHLDQLKESDIAVEPAGLEEAPLSVEEGRFDVSDRHGTGGARFISIEFIDSAGRRVDHIVFGEKITVRLGVLFEQQTRETNIGVLWRDSSGVDVLGNDSFNLGLPVPPQRPGSKVLLDFTVGNFCLKPGAYALTVAIGDVRPDGTSNTFYFDWINNAKILHVGIRKGVTVWTKVQLPMDIKLYNCEKEEGA
jgi:ABC-type polysaccharide/polyol phosphate transport system ATPase subunit